MAEATGEIVETPTQLLPYKAVIRIDMELVREQFFASRVEAEIFLAETLQALSEGASDDGPSK